MVNSLWNGFQFLDVYGHLYLVWSESVYNGRAWKLLRFTIDVIDVCIKMFPVKCVTIFHFHRCIALIVAASWLFSATHHSCVCVSSHLLLYHGFFYWSWIVISSLSALFAQSVWRQTCCIFALKKIQEFIDTKFRVKLLHFWFFFILTCARRSSGIYWRLTTFSNNRIESIININSLKNNNNLIIIIMIITGTTLGCSYFSCFNLWTQVSKLSISVRVIMT